MFLELVFWHECSLHPLGSVLTRKHQFKGYLCLLQKGLHTALEELLSLASATSGVQKHQHSAGPWEQSPGAVCYKQNTTKPDGTGERTQ